MLHIKKLKTCSENCKVLIPMTLIFSCVWFWSKANEKVCFGGKTGSGMNHQQTCISSGEPAYDIIMMITLGLVILVATVTVIELMGFQISFDKKEEEEIERI